MIQRALIAILTSIAAVLFSVVVAVPAQAIIVGVCEIKANYPHPSTHVSGTINSTGRVSCSLVMQEIYIQTYLEKSTGQSWVGNVEDYFNTNYEMSNAWAPCSAGPGTFRTRVSYAIHAPAGVNPSYTANTIWSPWVPAACGVQNAAPEVAVSETVRIFQT